MCSEDSDMWVMGVGEWHAGYSTCSTKRYRHVANNRTKSAFLGKMKTKERILFSMWRCNDYLPGLKGVGWKTAVAHHEAYKKLQDGDEKVCNSYTHMHLACLAVLTQTRARAFAGSILKRAGHL